MKLLLLLFLLVITTNAIGQDLYEFKKYVDVQMIGKKQIETNQDSTIFETTYLGKLELKEHETESKTIIYNVISQYYSVQAAIERHGHSQIIFLDEQGKTLRIYILDIPEELPTAIKRNGLKFGKTTKQFISLPDILCIPNGGCYEYY